VTEIGQIYATLGFTRGGFAFVTLKYTPNVTRMQALSVTILAHGASFLSEDFKCHMIGPL